MNESKILYFSKYRRNDKGFDSNKIELINFIKDNINKGLKRDINIGLLVIEYKGILIGLTTYGDSLNDITSYLNKALEITEYKLNIFVCSRHKNNIINEEFAYAGDIKVTGTVYKEKSISKDLSIYDRDNKDYGKKLFAEIKRFAMTDASINR